MHKLPAMLAAVALLAATTLPSFAQTALPGFDPARPCDQLLAVIVAEQKITARAEVSQASVRSGGDPTEDISELRQEMRALMLVEPQIRLDSLNGGCY